MIGNGQLHRGMMSTGVVLECQAGSQVWVESDSNECYVYATEDPNGITNEASTFGGFLLQRL